MSLCCQVSDSLDGYMSPRCLNVKPCPVVCSAVPAFLGIPRHVSPIRCSVLMRRSQPVRLLAAPLPVPPLVTCGPPLCCSLSVILWLSFVVTTSCGFRRSSRWGGGVSRRRSRVRCIVRSLSRNCHHFGALCKTECKESAKYNGTKKLAFSDARVEPTCLTATPRV